jgi:hypothetical protein
LEVRCTEDDHTFPAAWIVAAPSGVPSETIVATANVLYQPPTDTNSFALLELSKVLEQPATGPMAIVIDSTDTSCVVRLDSQDLDPNRSLFAQSDVASVWVPAAGSMIFQVLSTR